MMGHINNLLLRLVDARAGPEAVGRVFEIAGLRPREFRTEEIYPEAEFQALYDAVKDLFDLDDEAAQDAFAEFFLEVSPRMFPAIFTVAGSARALLERVPLIHKQWPSAASAGGFREKVILAEAGDRHIVYRYESPNRLCGVLTRAAELTLEHFDESGSVTERRCVHDGAPWCEVEIRFETEAGRR